MSFQVYEASTGKVLSVFETEKGAEIYQEQLRQKLPTGLQRINIVIQEKIKLYGID